MYGSHYNSISPFDYMSDLLLPSSDEEMVQIVIVCGTSEEAYQTYQIFRINGCDCDDLDDYLSVTMNSLRNYRLNIRIYPCPTMGSVAAGIYSMYLLSTLEPEWILMTGICAGNPDQNIQLGDLIVANSVFDLNYGKKDTISLQPNVIPYTIDQRIESQITKLNSEIKAAPSSDVSGVFGI